MLGTHLRIYEDESPVFLGLKSEFVDSRDRSWVHFTWEQSTSGRGCAPVLTLLTSSHALRGNASPGALAPSVFLVTAGSLSLDWL